MTKRTYEIEPAASAHQVSIELRPRPPGFSPLPNKSLWTPQLLRELPKSKGSRARGFPLNANESCDARNVVLPYLRSHNSAWLLHTWALWKLNVEETSRTLLRNRRVLTPVDQIYHRNFAYLPLHGNGKTQSRRRKRKRNESDCGQPQRREHIWIEGWVLTRPARGEILWRRAWCILIRPTVHGGLWADRFDGTAFGVGKVKCRDCHQNSTAPPDMIGLLGNRFLSIWCNESVGETGFVSQLINTKRNTRKLIIKITCKADLGSPCTILWRKRHVKLRVQKRLKAVQTVHSLHRLSQIYIICDNKVWSTTERKRRTIVGVSDDPMKRA